MEPMTMGVIAGGSALSGLMGSSSAKRAARAQAAAIREATALQRQIHNQTRGDLEGYRDMGTRGLDMMGREFADLSRSFSADDFQKDPGYQFRMDEAQKALERGAAARGGLMTGAHLKELTRYNQDFASNEYQNAYTRFNQDRDQRYTKLYDLIGTGQNAAAKTGEFGSNYANQAGANIIGGGNAQAASHIAGGNAWSNAMNQGMNLYGMMGSLSKPTPNINDYVNVGGGGSNAVSFGGYGGSKVPLGMNEF